MPIRTIYYLAVVAMLNLQDMKMGKRLTAISEKNLQWFSFTVVTISFAIQLLLVCKNIGHPQYTDMLAYMNDAYLCIQQGDWYPIIAHTYSDYLWAYGLINCLIAEHYLLGTMYYHSFLNVLMNAGIVYSLYIIGKTVYNRRTALYSIVLFSVLHCNITGVLLFGTEIPFLFFIVAAYALYVSKRNLLWMFVVGIMFFMANTIRPLTILFLIALFVFSWLRDKCIKRCVIVTCIYAISCATYGLFNERKVGFFSFQSETSGVNLIMGALDGADGLTSTGAALLHDKNGKYNSEWEKNKTYAEKEDIWKHDAIEWILQHPTQYILQTPKKLFTLFVDNSWTDRMLEGEGLIESLRSSQRSSMDKICILGGFILKNLTFYFLLILTITFLYYNKQELLSYKGAFVLLAFFGVATTCIFVVQSRYNYPFLFGLVLWSSYGLSCKYDDKSNDLEP